MKLKRNIVRKVRLTQQEDEMFRQKAKRYRTVAAMIRDAVKQYDDVLVKGKIDVMAETLALYKKYQRELGWYGSNLNQAMHRANELAIAGELDAAYMQIVLMPRITESLDFLRKIKDEQNAIYRKLMKLH